MAQDHFERHDHHGGVVDWNFNVTFSGQHAIAAMAEAYKPLLTKPYFYDPIPAEWLHATILRVGTIDQYAETEMLKVANLVQEKLRGRAFPEFHFGALKIIHGNVAFTIEPEKELEKLYIAVTESLEEVVGKLRATRSPYGHFIAHSSLAYSKARDNEEETEIALKNAHIKPATFRIQHMPLIKQWPTDGYYKWEVVKDVIIE